MLFGDEIQRRAKHVVLGMECLRTAVQFRPPPPTNGPTRTGEARKPICSLGFRAFLLSGLVRVSSLQAVRRWGHILGHPPGPERHMPPLTHLAIRKAKATERAQKIFDGGGLYLEISPKDSRWWRLKYRFDGKEKRLALGVYPDVPLALARQRRDDARQL